MGGLTKSPSLPAMPAVPRPVDTTAEDEATARLKAMERRRRGRGGTITTTERGLMSKAVDVPRRKTLLGE